MKRPVVAIVQARMDASRLPNKMMLWLNGLPVIEWVFRRVAMAKEIDRVVFALPDTNTNDVLAQYLVGIGAVVFRGSEADVLGRCCKAARSHNTGTVVRVCADNPLIAASEIDRLVMFFEKNDYNYAYNHIPRNNRYPDGLGAEITHFEVLDLIDREAYEPAHREHIFNYIWDNPGKFHIGTCDPLDESIAHQSLKLDMDTPEDYEWFLKLSIRPDMSAREAVSAALKYPRGVKKQ